jgi:lysophospholipase L1-like esterase
MDDAPGQASQAVSQHARYVTILMGANDLCTSSPDTMTSTGSFEADFQSTMAILMAQNPRAVRVCQQHPQPVPAVGGAER